MVAFAASPANAQTTANGPYYATPSWDQQLPASTRFIVLSNWGGAAVLDRETGLVWEKSPSTTPLHWIGPLVEGEAVTHCNQLTVGNRKGWRLPTVQELASLVDPTQSNPSLPLGHPFINVQSSFYWSATTFADDTSVAWGVFFSTGDVYNVGKGFRSFGFDCFVWCVRGGQGVDPQ
jgi:hypothetical protein